MLQLTSVVALTQGTSESTQKRVFHMMKNYRPSSLAKTKNNIQNDNGFSTLDLLALLFFVLCEGQSCNFFGRKNLHASYFCCKNGILRRNLGNWTNIGLLVLRTHVLSCQCTQSTSRKKFVALLLECCSVFGVDKKRRP